MRYSSKHENAVPSIHLVQDNDAEIDTIAIPGILVNDNDLWYKTVASALSKDGGANLKNVRYGNGNFDPDATIELVAAEVTRSLELGHHAVLFGSSLGGDLAPFIAERVKGMRQDGDINLSAILADAPYGAETLYPIPERLRDTLDAHPPQWRPGKVARAIGNATVMNLMTMPWGMPKRSETTYPTNPADRDLLMRLAYGDMDNDEPTDEVLYGAIVELARRGLSGNDFGAYVTQLEYMIRVGDDKLGSAIENGLDGQATYMMAGNQNVTVVQPLAMQRWADKKPDIQQIEVPSPHVAYTQMQKEWSEAIRQAYAGLSL